MMMAWQWSTLGQRLLDALPSIGITLVVGFTLLWLVRRLIHRVVEGIANDSGGLLMPLRRPLSRAQAIDPSRGERLAQRSRAVGQVLRSAASFAIYVSMFLLILNALQVNLTPFVASAGFVGVAVGFGTQSLIRDFVAGLFMMIEDQYGVGDVVDVGAATGTVEAVGLRVTRLRDVEGSVWYVRNGEIKRVGNKSQGFARAVIDVPIDLRSDVNSAQEAIQEAANRVAAEPDWANMILSEPEVWGVQSLTEAGFTVRLVVTTVPLEQWKVARELRARIKEGLDAAGISLPPGPGSITIPVDDHGVHVGPTAPTTAATAATAVTPSGTTKPKQPAHKRGGERDALTDAVAVVPTRKDTP